MERDLFFRRDLNNIDDRTVFVTQNVQVALKVFDVCFGDFVIKIQEGRGEVVDRILRSSRCPSKDNKISMHFSSTEIFKMLHYSEALYNKSYEIFTKSTYLRKVKSGSGTGGPGECYGQSDGGDRIKRGDR